MLTPDGGTYHTHIKKDEFGNETGRFDVTTSTDTISINEQYVEAWDLAGEMRKKYEASLSKAIEDGFKLNKPKLYFIIMVKKNPLEKKKIHIKIGITDKKLSKFYENTDFWEYDYVKGKEKLLWSIPHKSSMKLYLKDPENYDKNLIMWLRQFIAQEGMDLQKYEKRKVKLT